jgi:hypothetical protein
MTKTMLRTNLNSYFRDRVVRLTQRLAKEAIGLGNDLEPANPKAFETAKSTEIIAKQLGLLS